MAQATIGVIDPHSSERLVQGGSIISHPTGRVADLPPKIRILPRV